MTDHESAKKSEDQKAKEEKKKSPPRKIYYLNKSEFKFPLVECMPKSNKLTNCYA
jgi:hypothetical protein